MDGLRRVCIYFLVYLHIRIAQLPIDITQFYTNVVCSRMIWLNHTLAGVVTSSHSLVMTDKQQSRLLYQMIRLQ